MSERCPSCGREKPVEQKRVQFMAPVGLVEKLDEALPDSSYSNRSEALRSLLEDFLSEVEQ